LDIDDAYLVCSDAGIPRDGPTAVSHPRFAGASPKGYLHGMPNRSRRRHRFPARELLRFLVLPIALTLVVILVFMKPWRSAQPKQDGAFELVELVRKGGLSAVTSLFGGPAGSVWYTPSGSALSIRASAHDLEPSKHYIFEIRVDSTVYDVASLEADSAGDIALDSTFTEVAEGTCVGANYDSPARFVSGRSHTLGFMLKRDGNPANGAQLASSDGAAGAGEAATSLACSGNADGDYRYVLMESREGAFTAR
jgi:hypothetical protein